MNKKSFFKIITSASVVSMLAIGCAQEEGDDIITLPRDKFIGTWNVTSHGTVSGDLTWDLVIEPASAAAAEQIVMKNFDQQGTNTTVFADVDGSNLLIPGTTVANVVVEGTGSLNGATLTLDYTSTDSVIDSVHATATKQ
jgi:hypothetical protein